MIAQPKKRGRPPLPKSAKPRKKYYIKKPKNIPHGNLGKKHNRMSKSTIQKLYQAMTIRALNIGEFKLESRALKITQSELFEIVWMQYKLSKIKFINDSKL